MNVEKTEVITAIIESLRRFNRDMRRQTMGVWMETNITMPQMRVLFYIFNHGTTNFTRLASALGVTPSNITGIIDRLVEQGFVSRQENPEDRRQLILSLTDKGQNIVTGLRESRARRISEILERLSPEELAAVRRGFEILAQASEPHPEKGQK